MASPIASLVATRDVSPSPTCRVASKDVFPFFSLGIVDACAATGAIAVVAAAVGLRFGRRTAGWTNESPTRHFWRRALLASSYGSGVLAISMNEGALLGPRWDDTACNALIGARNALYLSSLPALMFGVGGILGMCSRLRFRR
jgi:hypothetical protein